MAELKVYWSGYPYDLILLQVRQPRTCGAMPRVPSPGRTLMCLADAGHPGYHRCTFPDGEAWEWM